MNPEITVIGCDGQPLGPEAATALAAASQVVGTSRHLEATAIPAGAERVELRRLDDALGAITAITARPGRTVVLASGDPGFFGIVRALRAKGMEPHVIPATSSVTLAFARLGLDWDDALVISAHGRDPRRALAAALAHPKAAILTAPGNARDLGTELLRANRQVYVAECLGAPAERITDLRAGPARDFAEPNILISVDPASTAGPRWLAGHQGAPSGWALPEDAFTHRDSMITKAEVRALVLARLGPGPGRTIWDVGAGAGSVAVECARFGARVIAVEADEAQCARIGQNAASHGVYVEIVHDRAPAALHGLPPADAIFAGGGDRAVLAAAVGQGRPDRVVVTLAAVQRVGETTDLLTDLGYQTEGVQLQASRLVPLPTGASRLSAVNPVFVLSARKPDIADRSTPGSEDSDPRPFRPPGVQE